MCTTRTLESFVEHWKSLFIVKENITSVLLPIESWSFYMATDLLMVSVPEIIKKQKYVENKTSKK